MSEQESTESPVLEQPGETAPQPTAEDQARTLLKELETIGVETPEDIRGMATASKEVGRMANQLGEVRQQLQATKTELELMARRPSERSQPAVDEYGNPTVDMSQFAKRDDIKSLLRSFYHEEIIAPQQRAMQENLKQVAAIQGDEDYVFVRPVWEQHFNNPNTQVALQTGSSNILSEYQKIVRTVYREALKKSKNVVEGVLKTKPTPPHMESGGSRNLVVEKGDSKAETIKNIIKPENWRGRMKTLSSSLMPSWANRR